LSSTLIMAAVLASGESQCTHPPSLLIHRGEDESLVRRSAPSAPNADVPLCQLPDEVLVDILKHVQGRFGVESQAYLKRDLAHLAGTTVYDVETLAWRHVMMVCTRIRDVALHSPELWSRVSNRWPQRWAYLCAERSEPLPLTLVCKIHNPASAHMASRLLPRARDAVMRFHMAKQDEEGDPNEWQHICHETIQTLASPRSLIIERAYDRMWDVFPITLFTPVLGEPSSTVTHLDLKLIRLEGPPNFPLLETLKLHTIIPPSEPAWLHRWLATSRQLKSLTLFTISPKELNSDVTLLCPVVLPRFTSLTMNDNMDVVLSAFRFIPTPTQELTIIISNFRGTDSVSAVSAPQSHELLRYIQTFWLSVSGRQELPTATIEVTHLYEFWHRRILQMRAPGQLDVSIYHPHASRLGPFLAYVKECQLVVAGLSDALAPLTWSELAKVTVLERLRICINHFKPSADTQATGIQTWADERARLGLPPVQVEIGQCGYSRPSSVDPPVFYTRLVWDPTHGPIDEEQWTDIDDSLIIPQEDEEEDERQVDNRHGESL
jgi:hypothetical protein